VVKEPGSSQAPALARAVWGAKIQAQPGPRQAPVREPEASTTGQLHTDTPCVKETVDKGERRVSAWLPAQVKCREFVALSSMSGVTISKMWQKSFEIIIVVKYTRHRTYHLNHF
jgi:hypothetical protein